MRGLVTLLLFATLVRAQDAKPLPVRRSATLSSGGTYFVEGRKEIRAGQELTVQNGTKIVGRGPGAELVVTGAFTVKGVKNHPVFIEDLTIIVAERCMKFNCDGVKLNRCRIRTQKDKTCLAPEVYFEECTLYNTSLDLRLHKGEVTLLNCAVTGAIKIVAAPLPEKRAAVKALLNTSNLDRALHVEGLTSLVVRACNVNGQSVRFLDCAVLTFDANVVKGKLIVFEQSRPGQFKKTKLQKSDFHKTSTVLFKAPRVAAKKDKIPVDKCWFEGVTDKDEILAKFLRDGHTREDTGAFVVFRKINKRALELGGRTSGRRK